MKLFNFIKRVCKENKWGYLNSIIAGTFACLLVFAKHKSPLQYTIPFMLLGTFILMFVFAFAIGDDK